MHDRIKAIISSLGIKKVEFARRLNLSQPFVSEMCSGKTRPSDRTIADICREFGVSEVWLRTGQGEMFLHLDEDAEFLEICEAINISDDPLIKKIIRAYWSLNDTEKAAIRKLIDGLTDKKSSGD
ncbi:helix-turn-helix domain-containing protein [Allofournierella sp.]|uniref:helix-turn-helix domain-containing protein n=1 Tax=Allofournierella sp. TaxID=1940256 RepID=UPI003AEF186A